MKIYVSTYSVKGKSVSSAIESLIGNGFRRIELSGGDWSENIYGDLLNFRQAAGVEFLCHNYFPPHKEPFTLNMASLNDEIYERTIQHYLSSLELSGKLGSKAFGIHSGFLVDIKASELGKTVVSSKLYDYDKAVSRFFEGLNLLRKHSGNIEIYVENNALSISNYREFEGKIPFLLTNRGEYLEWRKSYDFKLLLDIGHLKVSSSTLKTDFREDLKCLSENSDYWHISDNDSEHDLNWPFKSSAALTKLLSAAVGTPKLMTLEIYDNIGIIRKDYDCLEKYFNEKE